MALVVQKYGGSSVADAGKMKHVAKRVIRGKLAGNDMVVVVSAPGKTTDNLVEMAQLISPIPDEREMDMLLSTGEQQSIALLTMAIKGMGHKAISFTGQQMGIRTDASHTKARIVSIDGSKIKKALKEGKVVIAAGFQGTDAAADITTLGRGGSDTTAVALAAALKADVCEIYTDVTGVYTADPRLVSDARKIDRISYEEMLELASLGAGVLLNRSVEFASNHGVKIHVRSTFSEEEGTMVGPTMKDMEKVVVTGIAHKKNEAKLTLAKVPDKPGIAAGIFKPLADAGINVDMIIQNVSEQGTTDLSFTVMKSDLDKALAVMEPVKNKVRAKGLRYDDKVAKVSAVGIGMRSHAGVAAKMFDALAKAGINIQMISTSEIKVSCVVGLAQVDEAVKVVHKAFGLAKRKKK